MPKEKKPGWEYFKSEFFNEEFAVHEATGWVYFQKGARYSPDEIKLIGENGLQMDKASHLVKTILGGEIVRHEKHEAQTPQAAMPAAKNQGELDIF